MMMHNETESTATVAATATTATTAAAGSMMQEGGDGETFDEEFFDAFSNMTSDGIPIPDIWAMRIASKAYEPHVSTVEARKDVIVEYVSMAIDNMWNATHGMGDAIFATMTPQDVEIFFLMRQDQSVKIANEFGHLSHAKLLVQLKGVMALFWTSLAARLAMHE